MHASNAYLNGAGGKTRLVLVNLLLAGPGWALAGRAALLGPLEFREQAEKNLAEHATQPGSFQNDPDLPTNPNEVRERSKKQP